MEAVEVNQSCICSLGLAPECPAHPYRTRRYRQKPSGEAIRHADCPACAALGEADHEYGEHSIGGYRDIAAALTVGTVFCTLPKLDKEARFVVRNARTTNGALEIEVLEGWFTSPGRVWMNVPKRSTA